VAGIENDGLGRRVEHAVQRDGQLDGTEVRAEVAAGLGDRTHEEVADLLGQLRKHRGVEPLEIVGAADRLEQTHRVTHLDASIFRRVIADVLAV